MIFKKVKICIIEIIKNKHNIFILDIKTVK